MNKILMVNDQTERQQLDDNIKCELILKNELFDVNTLKIVILKSTDLIIDYKMIQESKLNIEINVLKDAACTLNEFKSGSNSKIRYQYNLDYNSTLNLYKIYDVDAIKEFVKIDLNGENATINYNFKTITKEYEKYDITVYHNYSNTTSNIINNGVNINSGNLIFNVSSFVENGKPKCSVTQNSRIVNLTNNKCQICPNLYIDEYDVIASHSAHIGTFKEEEVFYLMSRGLDKEEAINLLIKGFLLNNMNHLSDKIEAIIEKYWR